MPTEALSPADLRNYLGIGFQAVKGTAVAPTFFAAFVDQVAFGHNPNLRDIREAGAGQTIARQVKDYLAPQTEFATPVRPDIGGAIMAAVLGASPLPAGVGPYVHTITADPGVVWLTVERNLADDVIERIIDSLITSVTIDYRKRSSGPELMISCNAPGIRPNDQGAVATADTYETDRPFLRSDCSWTIDTTLTPDNVESATISIEWAVDEQILADLVTRSSLVKLHLTGSIEVVQLFESADEALSYRLTHYYDGDAVPGVTPGELVYPGDFGVVADYTDPAGANEQRTFEVEIPAVNWGEAELTEPNPDASEAVRLTRRGVMIGNPGGEPVTVTATNGRATAYVA